jgi:hypothetical protein
MSYGRRSGGRRNDYGRARTARHIDEAASFSAEVGGSDRIVKDAFFSLSGKSREYLFEEYAGLYGGPARDYAIKTIPKWRSGGVRMSGMVAQRLFALMPPYLPIEQKHLIVETIWKRYGPRSRNFMYIGPDSTAGAVVAEIERYFTNLSVLYNIPANLESRFDWLSDNDVTLKQQLLNHFLNEQRKAAIQSAKLNVDMILAAMKSADAGQILKLVHTVFVGNHQLELRADPLRVGYLFSDLDRQEVKPKPTFKWSVGFVAAAFIIAAFWLISAFSSGQPTTSSSSEPSSQSVVQGDNGGQTSTTNNYSGGNGGGSGSSIGAAGTDASDNIATAPAAVGLVPDPTPSLHHIRTRATSQVGALLVAPKALRTQIAAIRQEPAQITAIAKKPAVAEGCVDTMVATVQGDGSILRLANGVSYDVSDNGLMRTMTQGWSTGDAVTTCTSSGGYASIRFPKKYEKVQGTIISSNSSTEVSCADAQIVRVSDGAATVDLTNGYSYAVSEAGLMRTMAAGWSTGDNIQVCRTSIPDGTIAASISFARKYEKVQTTLIAQHQASSVVCRDAAISSVGESGESVTTSDGRAYAVSRAGLMRTMAQGWTPGDVVAVCESHVAGGVVAASIEEAARYEKIQAIRS